MSEPDTLLVMAASYGDVAEAEADYEAIKALYYDVKSSHDFDAAVLQRVRVGESVMVAGYGGLREDVIPFGYVMHPFGRLTGVNLIGMRRRGIKRESIHAVRAAYAALFKGEGRFADRIERIATDLGGVPEVARIIAFLRSAKRPIMMATPRGSHIDQFE